MATNFSAVPSISISRSKFHRQPQHKTTMKLGEITPIFVDEKLPGTTCKFSFSSLIRMVTPVAPVMDNIFVDVFAMFIPYRLCWTHWREFMGENTSGAGYSATEYTIPMVNIDDYYSESAVIHPGKLGDHLGFPVNLMPEEAIGEGVRVSALPGRAYWLVYNRYFRDQNLIAPVPVNLGDNVSGQDDDIIIGNSYNYNNDLAKAAKDSDVFTRATPWAQKGAPVSLPLGTIAPIKASDVLTSLGNTLEVGSGSFAQTLIDGNIGLKDGKAYATGGTESGTTYPINKTNLYADLSTATAANINDLRFAFAYQKMLEKDALYGTRYWEILKGHFGVIAPDASLQDPQHLGWKRFYINVDQVAQTTGYSSTKANNTLGTPGANSVTGIGNADLCTYSVSEHGIFMVLAVARHKQTYCQGINRLWTHLKRSDKYLPCFANLGSSGIKNKEIFAAGNGNDDKIFGYQEAWYEYRMTCDQVSGYLRPNLTSGNVPFWTLANNFASLPTLGQTFIEQDRNALGRLLVTGSEGDFDFITDWCFDEVEVVPMPTYSIPGLIDHH